MATATSIVPVVIVISLKGWVHNHHGDLDTDRDDDRDGERDADGARGRQSRWSIGCDRSGCVTVVVTVTVTIVIVTVVVMVIVVAAVNPAWSCGCDRGGPSLPTGRQVPVPHSGPRPRKEWIRPSSG
jgi:hypothetical protein